MLFTSTVRRISNLFQPDRPSTHSLINIELSAIVAGQMATTKTYQQPKLETVALPVAMQALADPCRLAIVRALLQHPHHEFACNEFGLDLSKATISHHFKTLRNAGLIKTRVDGRKCLSSLRETSFEKRFPGLLNLVATEKEK